jgi:hypothetical protein
MSKSKKVCPECSNNPSIIFKCYNCDKQFCEQCTLRQRIDVSQDKSKSKFKSKVEIKHFCPRCNRELHEMTNIAKHIK